MGRSPPYTPCMQYNNRLEISSQTLELLREGTMAVHLETERLILCHFAANDVENLVALDSDPEVMRFLNGGVPTPRDVVQSRILPGFLHSYERFPGFGVWAAIGRASGDFLGWLSLRPPEGGTPADVALGYRLRRKVWGQGFAAEGARALIHQAFTGLGTHRVFATTYEHNLASRRVLEKAGLRLVRRYRLTYTELAKTNTFDVVGQDVWEGDEVEYELLKPDWERIQANRHRTQSGA